MKPILFSTAETAMPNKAFNNMSLRCIIPLGTQQHIDNLQYDYIMSYMEQIEVFKALSNEARLQILDWLKDPKANFSPQEGIDLVDVGVCVSQITKKLKMNQSTASQYLSMLQRAGLISATRLGKWTYYKRNEDAIDQIGLFLKKNT